MNNKLLDEIINIIANITEIDKNDINLKTNLIGDLNLDSLDFIDIVTAFEEKYNIEILDEDIKNIQTIEDIYNYVKPKI